MKKYYLDNIRWITVVIVAIYHVIYIYNGVQPFGVIGPFKEIQYQDAFQYLVYPWFMALLFVVSGMCSRYSLEKKTTREFIRSRTVKLLVPSTIGLFVFQWIQGYYNMKIGNAFETMDLSVMPKVVLWGIMSVSGCGVLWYIQMLWIFSIILILIRKIEKDRLFELCKGVKFWMLLIFTVMYYLSAQVLNTPVITVYRFGIYGLCFLLGYYVFAHEEVMERLTGFWLPLLVAAIVLGVTYTVIYFGKNYAVEPYVNNILACIYGWIAILAILAGMKKWADETNGFATWMSGKSWGLYIFHYLPMSMTAYYLDKSGVQLWIPLYYVIVLVAEFVGAYVLYEIISRIPVIRWCLLGIRKSK